MDYVYQQVFENKMKKGKNQKLNSLALFGHQTLVLAPVEARTSCMSESHSAPLPPPAPHVPTACPPVPLATIPISPVSGSVLPRAALPHEVNRKIEQYLRKYNNPSKQD